MPVDYASLRRLLRRRLDVIGDHAWRDRDPDGQLAALAEASEAIAAWHRQHRAEIPGRLHHFLSQSSLEKALAWIEGGEGTDPSPA